MAFSIKQTTENGFEEVLVKNTSTGVSFRIIPTHGAALNSFFFKNQEWIEGYKDTDEMNEKPFKSALLAPFPNRIKDGKYDWKNMSYQLPINRPQEQHAIHGFLYNRSFEIYQKISKKNKAIVSFKHQYHGDYEGFPFPFLIKITYSLSIKNRLKIKTSIKNVGNETLPFGLGFHPYFKTSILFDESVLSFPACQNLPLDDRKLPTGAMQPFTDCPKDFVGKDLLLDDCFKVEEKGVFILKDSKTENSIAVYSKNLPFFQLYTPANRKSVAIEPMTCPPNVLNHKMNLLEIKPSKKFTCSWYIKGVR